MQSSLDKWFVKSKSSLINNKLAHIFYFDYKTGYAEWLDDINNKKVYLKRDIQWKCMKSTITICSNFDRSLIKMENEYCNINNLDNKSHLVPFLKSHLQKCIRRSLVIKSLQTAKLLIKIDFLEFIRRLSIIMLEDCILHKSFTKITWMISAYPYWKPNKNDLDWLLGLVKLLAQVEYRDFVQKEEFNFKSNLVTINKLDNEYKSLIYSLYFRVSYGGMKGDMKMLEYFSKIWIERLSSIDAELLEVKFLNTNIDLVDINLINKLDINEIEISSIDFHCYPIILNYLTKYTNIETDKIKKAIWYHSSRITNKKLLYNNDSYNNEYLKNWQDIKNKLIFIQNKIKSKIFEEL